MHQTEKRRREKDHERPSVRQQRAQHHAAEGPFLNQRGQNRHADEVEDDADERLRQSAGRLPLRHPRKQKRSDDAGDIASAERQQHHRERPARHRRTVAAGGAAQDGPPAAEKRNSEREDVNDHLHHQQRRLRFHHGQIQRGGIPLRAGRGDRFAERRKRVDDPAQNIAHIDAFIPEQQQRGRRKQQHRRNGEHELPPEAGLYPPFAFDTFRQRHFAAPFPKHIILMR